VHDALPADAPQPRLGVLVLVLTDPGAVEQREDGRRAQGQDQRPVEGVGHARVREQEQAGEGGQNGQVEEFPGLHLVVAQPELCEAGDVG
jgi:hypothetical protein